MDKEEDCSRCNEFADKIRERNLLRRTFNAVREKANTPEERCLDCGRTPREKTADARYERNLLGRSLFKLRDKHASIQSDRLLAEIEAEEAARVARVAKAAKRPQKKPGIEKEQERQERARELKKKKEADEAARKEAERQADLIKQERRAHAKIEEDERERVRNRGLYLREEARFKENVRQREIAQKAAQKEAAQKETTRREEQYGWSPFTSQSAIDFERSLHGTIKDIQSQPGQASSASTRPSYLSGGYRYYTYEWFNYCF